MFCSIFGYSANVEVRTRPLNDLRTRDRVGTEPVVASQEQGALRNDGPNGFFKKNFLFRNAGKKENGYLTVRPIIR